jgi:hypothetical protein
MNSVVRFFELMDALEAGQQTPESLSFEENRLLAHPPSPLSESGRGAAQLHPAAYARLVQMHQGACRAAAAVMPLRSW